MRKKIAVIVSILVVIAIMVVGLISLVDDKEDTTNTDALKFKEEYESINGKYDELTNLTAPSVTINKNNPIKYLSDSDILDKLTKDTNIIYMGYPEDGFSRRILPVLFDFANKNKIKTIYYYNFYNLQQDYEKNEDQEKIALYENIINVLGDTVTETYTEGIHSGIKRLSAPSIYFIKDGQVVGSHYNAVESYTNFNIDLTSEEAKELFNIYQDNYNKMFANVCQEETLC